MWNRSHGFTLIELAVVLVVLGLMFGALLIPLATQVDMARIKETNDYLDTVQEALLGFAIGNFNRLPCADTDEDGLENLNLTGDNCASFGEGDLPWRTLGVGPRDAWGRVLRYQPDEAFAASGVPPGVPSDAATAGKLLVKDRDGNELTPPTSCSSLTGNGPAAIVYSLGKNGAPDAENGIVDSCPGSVHTYTQDVFTENVFDDQLIWLSKNTLVSRLAAAGTWPP